MRTPTVRQLDENIELFFCLACNESHTSEAMKKQPSHLLVPRTPLKHKAQYWPLHEIVDSKRRVLSRNLSVSINTMLWNRMLALLLPVACFVTRDTLRLWGHKFHNSSSPPTWTVECFKSLHPETWRKSQPWKNTIQNAESPNCHFHEGKSETRKTEHWIQGKRLDVVVHYHENFESKGASTEPSPDLQPLPCLY